MAGMDELWCEPRVETNEGVPDVHARPWVSPAPRWQILVVAGDSALVRDFEQLGYATRVARDGTSAIVALQQDRPDGVILNLTNVAAPDGVALLRRVRAIDAAMPVVAFASPAAGHGAIAAEFIRTGVFLMCSSEAPELIHAAFQRALSERRQADVLTYYRQRDAKRSGLEQLIGESVAMLRLKTQLRLLLDAEARRSKASAVLLQGDSGTGKEAVARALHVDGARRDCAFVRVDADDMVTPEAEARLFGRERGGDTLQRQVGLIEAADGGTVFIDDVGSLSLTLQSRISRLLEQGTLRRVGGARDVPVDVRVVAATRCPVEALLRSGRLSLELHRRLAEVALQLVPLRERGDDVWLLADWFVTRASKRFGMAPSRLSSAARSLLASHHWPGNVRELRQSLERAVLLQADGVIDSVHLAFASAPPQARSLPAPSELSLHRLEREALAQALQRAYGNVTKAAQMLGVSRDTMRYRIAKHELGGARALR